MNTKNQRNLALAVAVILLLASGFLFFRSLDLSNEVTAERLSLEAALSDKIDLTKSLNEAKGTLESFRYKNSELSSILESTREQFIEKEKELNRLRQSQSALVTYKKKASDLETIKRELDQKILELTRSSVALKEQIDGLEQRIAAANGDKAGLESRLNDLLNKPFSDNYRTEAQRGRRNILTVIARRTNKLNISMDVPANLQQELNFLLTIPGGKTLSSAGDLSNEVRIIDSDASFVVDKGYISGTEQAMKRVQLLYSPAKRLKKGIYKYQLYSGIRYLGSAQINLK